MTELNIIDKLDLMKNILNKLIALLIVVLTFPQLASSQNALTNEPGFDVHKVYPHLSLTGEQLKKAQTLIDLNERYKSSWIREYISVEISAIHKGKERKAMGKNDSLNQEQKDIMNGADLGTYISVTVRYMPENNLKHNDPKEMDFTFTVDPENDAKYSDGPQQLKQYLKEKAIDKIPDDHFKGYDLAAVKFTISEEGEIINPHVFETSKDEKIDQLLLEAIRTMPCWKPAEYANGTKLKQEFVLTIGSMESCVVNLLNIRRN